jgi:hypothetical protein
LKRIRPGLVALASAALLIIVVFAVPAVRLLALRAAGRALVAEDPVGRADEIVIAVGGDGAGALEAAELVRAHVSDRVAVFADPPDAADRELRRRGLPYYDAAGLEMQQLRALGISEAETIPWPVDGTHDEGRVLPRWCAERGCRTILFVSATDHSRRTRRILRRELSGTPITVSVRCSKYSLFDPDAWWRTRSGIRIEIVESEKLLMDVLLHPLS